MANTITKLMDTDWRGQTHVTMTADTNSSPLTVVDASNLSGWVAGSLLALSKIYWNTDSPAAGVIVSWGGTGGVSNAFVLIGSGSYGYTSGQPAITCSRTSSTAVTSDILLTNAAACNGTFVIEYTKMALNGSGWSA
jgi:hypothetical protein